VAGVIQKVFVHLRQLPDGGFDEIRGLEKRRKIELKRKYTLKIATITGHSLSVSQDLKICLSN
jgi:hypothetical protein